MAVLKTGHRRRGSGLDTGMIPDLLAGILLAQQFGNDWYVSSTTGSASNDGRSPDSPFASLVTALARAAANDRIFIAPGHSETITGVGGLTAAVAGVEVIGLGRGTQRPTFLMDGGTTVTFAISAASVLVHNCIFLAGHADIVTCFNITAKGVHIDACEFRNNVVDENFLTEIKCTSTSDNNADYLSVTRCRAYNVDAAGLEFIELNADVDGAIICDNFVVKDAATAAPLLLCATGKDVTNVAIIGNVNSNGNTANDLFIDNDTANNSGVIDDNLMGHHDTAAAVPIDCTGARIGINRSISTDDVSALMLPAVDDNA